MENNDPMYDSDEELLPLKIYDCEPSSEPLEIKVGEIVWAKFRQYYWPSLIRNVYKKEKKASLWYLDSPRKCFKVPFKNIHRWKDRAFSNNVEKEVSDSPMKALHARVMTMTIEYIRRKGEGIVDDPADYFDRSNNYLSLYDLKKKIENNSLASEKTMNLVRDGLNSQTRDSEEESVPDSDEEDERVNEFMSELILTDSDYCPEDKVDAIIACITSRKLDKYLLDVLSRKIFSQRRVVFDEYVKASNVEILYANCPNVRIKDSEKVRAIYNHLQNLYESVVEKGCRDQLNYIMYVWYPDALDKALAIIDGSSDAQSENSSGVKRKLFEEQENQHVVNGDLENVSDSPNKTGDSSQDDSVAPVAIQSNSEMDIANDSPCMHETPDLNNFDSKLKSKRGRKPKAKSKSTNKLNKPKSEKSNNCKDDIHSLVGDPSTKKKLPKKLKSSEPTARVLRSRSGVVSYI